MTILLVDDSPVIQMAINSILKSGGHENLITAKSAREAFHLLGLTTPGAPSGEINLILMDIVMPEMDGIEACRKIKEDIRFQDIPVIMVTARTNVEDLQMAFDAGAMDYIKKPFNQVEILARVRSAIKLKSEIDRRKAREVELMEVTVQLKEANQILQRLSSMDGLTGIANRRQFDEVLNNEFRRAARDGAPLSLIILDLDYFKAYNDTYGHQAGDNCLKQVALALNETIRRAGDLVARYGGEEFGVVLPNTDETGAAVIAELLRLKVETMQIAHVYSRVSDYVTVSLGVASSLPGPDTSPEKLIAAADQALYQAKQGGRNRIKVFQAKNEPVL